MANLFVAEHLRTAIVHAIYSYIQTRHIEHTEKATHDYIVCGVECVSVVTTRIIIIIIFMEVEAFPFAPIGIQVLKAFSIGR